MLSVCQGNSFTGMFVKLAGWCFLWVTQGVRKNFIFTSLLKSALIACLFVSLFGYYQIAAIEDQWVPVKVEEVVHSGQPWTKSQFCFTRTTDELCGIGQSVYIHTCEGMCMQFSLGIRGHWVQVPKIQGCSSLWYKNHLMFAYNLHNPPIYFQSSLDESQCLT